MNESLGKYDRKIVGLWVKDELYVDVYDVLVAFNVTCPARAHAIKKLLCAGLRGKGDENQDLTEAAVAVQRAVTIANSRNKENV